MESVCSTLLPTIAIFRMQSERPMRLLTGAQVLLEKGNDLAEGLMRELDKTPFNFHFFFTFFFSLNFVLKLDNFLSTYNFPISFSFSSLPSRNLSELRSPPNLMKKNYLMRVGKRGKTQTQDDLERNARPDVGFLTRLGRSDQSLRRKTRTDIKFLTRVGKADPFFIDMLRHIAEQHKKDSMSLGNANNAVLMRLRRASGDKIREVAYLTRVGRTFSG